MTEPIFDCVLCPGVEHLSAHEMVIHFEAVHPDEALAALEHIEVMDRQRAVAWLN